MATPSSSSAAAAVPAVSHALAAVALSLLMGLQPVTTDVYLPALPILTRALGASMTSAQLTMSALILAFGIAQMVWGPVADRYGRRPVLLAGLTLFVVASVGGTLASGIDTLIVWRIVQGIAMAAAVVCARAIVRDLYEPVEGAQVMALALSGLGVIALSGPLVGGTAALFFGWRGALGVVAAVGVVALVFIAWKLPETIRQRNPHAIRVGPLLRAWRDIARHPVFVAWALLVACTYGGLFTVLAASSFVYMDVLGLSPTAYGAAMAVGSTCYLLATLVCRRWIRAYGMAGAVARGAGFTFAAGVLIVSFTVAGVHTWWIVLAAHCVFMVGHGMHQPCGQAGVVGPFPHHAGAASALAGLILALVAFGIGRWLGVALDGTLRPLAWGLGFWSAATAIVAWTLVQRRAG